jgi:hypothetical protein
MAVEANTPKKLAGHVQCILKYVVSDTRQVIRFYVGTTISESIVSDLRFKPGRSCASSQSIAMRR